MGGCSPWPDCSFGSAEAKSGSPPLGSPDGDIAEVVAGGDRLLQIGQAPKPPVTEC